MPTPNLYADGLEEPFVEVPPPFQNNSVDVLYVTDRTPEKKNDVLSYGTGRSDSLAFGSAIVKIGQEVSWEELVAASKTHDRKTSLPLTLDRIEEHGRFANFPFPLVRVGEQIDIDPTVLKEQELLLGEFMKELDRRLAMTPKKDVYVFVHGFNNTFEDAVFVMAELWHFLGREGVPLAYTWPAGSGASVAGYDKDYESSEFTTYHLKQTLRVLASNPNVENIHILAHSRGTAVVTTALRELVIAAFAGSEDPRKVYKIKNLVLAAPDLDYQVALMRLGADRILMGTKRVTFYVSKEDKAMGLAEWIFGGGIRVGAIQPDEINPTQVENMKIANWVNFVDARIPASGIGHSYYRKNPAASSDLIQVLRYNRDPGEEHGRPLNFIQPGFWFLTDDYPQAKPQ